MDKICNGCGHIKTDTESPYLRCCPDSDYYDIDSAMGKNIKQIFKLLEENEKIEKENIKLHSMLAYIKTCKDIREATEYIDKKFNKENE